ncbi:MAG: UDP-N-acetyl-D-glucosamine 6-dehydrogenase [Chloroflexi bacterium ADurb.Bin325]|nr:MAG: UDP-N-acetyl-D-glucosamine 6-dehydrogenase [Chloroflexi bacterium ADurb.Bin325]
MKETLLEKIRDHRATVAVIGLGYVGLPLVVAFAERGFPVIGIDVDAQKVAALNRGESYVQDIPSARLQAIRANFRATASYAALTECDAAIICVPTPLNKTRDPDVRYLIAAGESIAQYIHPDMLIVLESTTYPGTTEELLLPMLAGPAALACREVAAALYAEAIEQVVPVSSTQTAEMVKLLENTFRAVNIALVNETAIMCDKLGVDVWEVIEAAATKPYGFMKFTPGPGVGGHCIPLDPHYLSWKLKTLNYNARFIQLAGEINTDMPRYWVDKVQDALNSAGKALKGSRVLVLGVAYKKDIDDVRESPALDIIELLRGKGAQVSYHDPYVRTLTHNGRGLSTEPDLDQALAAADCVIIVTDHSIYDWANILQQAALVVDTRNVRP